MKLIILFISLAILFFTFPPLSFAQYPTDEPQPTNTPAPTGAPYGTIYGEPNPCETNSCGVSTCGSTITWNAYRTTSATVIVRETGQVFAVAKNGSQIAPWIDVDGYHFDLYAQNGTFLDYTYVRARLPLIGYCQPTIVANPPTTSCSGNNPSVSFSYTAPNADSYQITRNDVFGGSVVYTGTSTSFSESLPVNYSNTQFTYTVTAQYNDPLITPKSITTTSATFPNCYYAISGTVYIDNNRNGAYDAGDAPYTAGTNILLNGGNAQTTNGSGAFSYDSLVGANYTLALQSVPTGYVATTATSYSITLNTPSYQANFGIVPAYTLGCSNNGIVYIDHDRSGTYNAGDGLYNGATVTLTGTETYTGTPVNTSTTTAANGQYCFFNIYAGTYTITLTTPASYAASTTQANLTMPPSNTGTTFAIVPLYQISGVVFNDQNKDGIRNGAEPAMTGNFDIQLTGPTNTNLTAVNGVYSSGATLFEGTYAVSLTSSLPSEYSMTYPLNGPPPSFTVSVGRSCTTNGINTAACVAGPAQSGGSNISGVNFGMSNYTPWFQCIGGNCRIETGFTNPIPSTAGNSCPVGNTPYASLPNPPSVIQPGILYSGNSSFDFGSGQASAAPYNWQVGGSTYPEIYAPSIKRTSYSYMTASLRQSGITATNLTSVSGCGGGGNGSLGNCTLPATLASGIYQANGDVTLNAYTFQGGRQYIFLIDGDLDIQGEITIPVGSSATFSVSGDITVNRSIGETDVCSTTCNVDGWFSADGSFIVDGYNSCTNYATDPTTRDRRLNVCGGIAVNAGGNGGTLQNDRDLCDNDLYAPAFSLIFRPDLILNAPEFLKYRTDVWQEVAP